MSYPSIGMKGILPDGVEWNAESIERLFRRDGVGMHVYFEDTDQLGVALFNHNVGKFQYTLHMSHAEDRIVFESESFLEFAVWVAFFGRDFL